MATGSTTKPRKELSGVWGNRVQNCRGSWERGVWGEGGCVMVMGRACDCDGLGV